MNCADGKPCIDHLPLHRVQGRSANMLAVAVADSSGCPIFLRRLVGICLLGALSGGCLSSTLSTRNVPKETIKKDFRTEPPVMKLVEAQVDYDSSAPCLRLSVTGSVRNCWMEGTRHEVIKVISQRTWDDPVTTPTWPGNDMALTRRVGFFSLSHDLLVDEEKTFAAAEAVGFYPWTASILDDKKHFAGFDGEFAFSADGRIESPLLPFTLSGEWLAAGGNTVGLACASALSAGIFTLGSLLCLADGSTDEGKSAREAWMGPITLVGAPLCDAVVLSVDTALTTGAVALDLVKDVAIVGVDLAGMGCAVAADLSWKSVTLLGDAAFALGDLAWPGTVNTMTITNSPPEPSNWDARECTEPLPRSAYQAYRATFATEGHKWEKPVGKTGEVCLDLVELGGKIPKRTENLVVSLERRDGGSVNVEPLNIEIDLLRVRKPAIPGSLRSIPY